VQFGFIVRWPSWRTGEAKGGGGKVCTRSINCLVLFVNPVMDRSNQWL
jgi:hypothetical protein